MLFAAGEPVTVAEIQDAFARARAESPDVPEPADLTAVIDELKQRWSDAAGRGFVLVEVAQGLTFRSHPRFAALVRALRQERPARLSRASLEVLAIVAYRQPVTKPEIDHIRGVDSGAPLHLVLERGLLRITGKKEEPGRPLLYATTREFLSFFNLASLAELPSLREYHELSEESQDEVAQHDQLTLSDLRERAKGLGTQDEPGVAELEEAMSRLNSTADSAEQALKSQGLSLRPPAEPTEPPGEALPTDSSGQPEPKGSDSTPA
ncbi:MAG: SMC-Scp complex subunit ScpB [Deltaproteobacteria bacterium]|nr:SMC-Scp complex subunit ScpB [Deltaproteobacteria bacterium]